MPPASQLGPPRDIDPSDPLQTGATLQGELGNPEMEFRMPVSMTVVSRDDDSFEAILEYGDAGASGRRGLGGQVAPGGKFVTMWSLWHEGKVSPEAARYDLTLDGATLSGTWESPTYRGTLHLGQ